MTRRKPAAARETFGARLHRMRKARGRTQAEVAAVAGTTESYVSRLEAGIETNPSAKVVAGLADALKTSTDWLLGRTAA